MIEKPMFISPRTFRNYEQYKAECARAEGWNDAMRYIFGEELALEEAEKRRESFKLIDCNS